MNARALPLFALLALAACGNKTEGGGAPTASASAKPHASTTATATAATTAPTATAAPTASASAAPTASADAEPAGAVHMHLDSVKVASGKSDNAEKTLKGSMLKLRTACVAPALKKTPTFEGTLRVTLEVGADGKITKATPKALTGKLPDDLQQCVGKFHEEKVQLDAGKAKVEETLLFGPNVAADK